MDSLPYGYLAAAVALMAGAVMAVMHSRLGLRDPGILAIQFAYTRERYAEVLGKWGPDGQARFKSHFAYDFVFLALYGLAGWLLMQWHAARAVQDRTPGELWIWMMPAAAVLDAAENILQLTILKRSVAAAPGWMFAGAGVAATGKWAAIVAFAGYWVSRAV